VIFRNCKGKAFACCGKAKHAAISESLPKARIFFRKISIALYKAHLHLNRRARTEIFIYSIYLYYGINIYGDENA